MSKDEKKGTIQLNAVPKTEKEVSKQRMLKLTTNVFKAINDTVEEMKAEKSGELTVNEVISVMGQMVYNYNQRMLDGQYQEQKKKG